ncbi:MAG: Jag N-terminal domain-containing protein [Candidatus Hydrogenedentes bacterium]|nr:Jag N-terminal domain-containing protein [Candidatus Hydrogenedentota bacterium]
MRQVEVIGATREEAVQKALEILGVPLEEVDKIEVLDEGSKGIFGIGARPVKVRATVEKLPPLEEEIKHKSNTGQQHDEIKPKKIWKKKEGEISSGRETNVSVKSPKKEFTKKQEKKIMESTHSGKATSQESEKCLNQITEEQGAEASSLLKELLSKMGIDAQVKYLRTPEGVPKLEIDSQDGALIIGRKGGNLEAIQFLINRMYFGAEENEAGERFVVDTENYLARRKDTLRELALREAEKVKRTGKKVRLSPMPPHERRVIHLTLQNDRGIETYSVGKEGDRCVVIAPKFRKERRMDNRRQKNNRNTQMSGRASHRDRNHRDNRGGRRQNRFEWGKRRQNSRSPYEERDVDPGQVSD